MLDFLLSDLKKLGLVSSILLQNPPGVLFALRKPVAFFLPAIQFHVTSPPTIAPLLQNIQHFRVDIFHSGQRIPSFRFPYWISRICRHPPTVYPNLALYSSHYPDQQLPSSLSVWLVECHSGDLRRHSSQSGFLNAPHRLLLLLQRPSPYRTSASLVQYCWSSPCAVAGRWLVAAPGGQFPSTTSHSDTWYVNVFARYMGTICHTTRG